MDRSATVHDLNLSRQIDLSPTLYVLAPVAGWDPCNLHHLAQVSWVGICTMADPSQHLTTAGEDLDHPDHDLSDLSHAQQIKANPNSITSRYI